MELYHRWCARDMEGYGEPRLMARPTRTSLPSGPNFIGVDDNPEHFGGNARTLQDARNIYIPDTKAGSNVFAREGFELANPDRPLTGRGQGIFTHVDGNGDRLNVLAQGGRLYRTDAFGQIEDDITPVGVSISSTVTRVYFWSFIDFLIVSDGVNPPWIASDLQNTPITGTYIDIDGSGTPWAAYGRPTEYAGSLIFIIDNVGGVQARNTFVWSSPGDPTEGYEQPAFDYTWTLKQTGTTPLYAMWGTNIGLFYFRDTSIGLIAGTPGPNFESTHTADAVSANVGCLQSATIDQYSQTIFFCDAEGKPWRMNLGSPPDPIWLQLRSVIAESTSTYNSATAQVSVGVIDPSSSRYNVAVWASDPGTINPPTSWLVFDCKTGKYLGQWSIRSGSTVEAIGYLNNGYGSSKLVVLGNGPGGGSSPLLSTERTIPLILTTESGTPLATIDVDAVRTGCVWVQGATVGDGDDLLTEDGFEILTEDFIPITTENVIVSWKDEGVVPEIYVTTQRLGESEDAIWNIDQVTFIAGTDSPVDVTLQTPNYVALVQATPEPLDSGDGSTRGVVGMDGSGRGPQLKLQPTEADEQWRLEKIAMTAIGSKAGPDDR